MPSKKLCHLELWDHETGMLKVIIETPKGSHNKFKYEEEPGLFTLASVLPLGESFPFDFGFIPSTRGEDGDPLDVLVLMDQPAFTGCLINARLIGVIEAEQTENGKTERNDRLVCVAEKSRLHEHVRSLKRMEKGLIEEIEHFFTSYNEVKGKEFKVLGYYGPKKAEKLIRQGAKRCRRQSGSGADKRRHQHAPSAAREKK